MQCLGQNQNFPLIFKRIFFSPVNPEIHACHLHRFCQKDKEGTCLDLLVPGPPFQLSVKTLERVSKCFVFIREHLILLLSAMGQGGKKASSCQHPGALSLPFRTPSLYRQISIMDQRGSSFCFSVTVRDEVGGKEMGTACHVC